MEKALNAIQGVDHQRQWQDEEVRQARIAFDLAQQRYAAGAETLLSVLQTQRTLYDAQDQQAQLRLARLQGSVALYKALGVAGRCLRAEGHRGRNAAPGHRSGHDVLQRKMPRIPGPARHPPHQIADRIILAKGDAQRQFHDLDIHLHRLAGTRAGTVLQPWVSGPSQGSSTSTQRPGANQSTPLTCIRRTWPGW